MFTTTTTTTSTTTATTENPKFSDHQNIGTTMEIYRNLASNLIKKSLINQHFSLYPAYATILAGFASVFYADLCRRFVFSLIRNPFRDRSFLADLGPEPEP